MFRQKTFTVFSNELLACQQIETYGSIKAITWMNDEGIDEFEPERLRFDKDSDD